MRSEVGRCGRRDLAEGLPSESGPRGLRARRRAAATTKLPERAPNNDENAGICSTTSNSCENASVAATRAGLLPWLSHASRRRGPSRARGARRCAPSRARSARRRRPSHMRYARRRGLSRTHGTRRPGASPPSLQLSRDIASCLRKRTNLHWCFRFLRFRHCRGLCAGILLLGVLRAMAAWAPTWAHYARPAYPSCRAPGTRIESLQT